MHVAVDLAGEILCLDFQLHRILMAVQEREQEVLRGGRIAPLAEDRAHLGSNDRSDLFAGFGGAGCLLANETDFAVDDVGIFEPDEVGYVDPVAEVDEKPQVAIVSRGRIAVRKIDDLFDLAEIQGDFSALALLDFEFSLPERVLGVEQVAVFAGFVQQGADRAHVHADGHGTFLLAEQEFLVAAQPDDRHGCERDRPAGEPFDRFEDVVVPEHVADSLFGGQADDPMAEEAVQGVALAAPEEPVEGVEREGLFFGQLLNVPLDAVEGAADVAAHFEQVAAAGAEQAFPLGGVELFPGGVVFLDALVGDLDFDGKESVLLGAAGVEYRGYGNAVFGILVHGYIRFY